MVIGPVWRQEIEESDGSSNQLPFCRRSIDAAIEIGDVTGDALDLRVLDRLDDDVVAEPVDADLADLLGRGASHPSDDQCSRECQRSAA